MKIMLEYSEQELSTLLDGLNNAIIAVKKIYLAAQLGCEIPQAFAALFNGKSFEEIDSVTEKRLSSLYNLYQVLLHYEN